MSETFNTEILIVGGGVVGLSVARELLLQKKGSVTVIEKEESLGKHASGKNSGVLHAGIYYPSASLKAKLCVNGRRMMEEYCRSKNIPVLNCGKVVVGVREKDNETLELIFNRAREMNVPIERIDKTKLKEIEPQADCYKDALWSPSSAITDPKKVLAALHSDIISMGGKVLINKKFQKRFDENTIQLETGELVTYKFLVNCGGTFADKIAHEFGLSKHLRILPFKGIYWATSDEYSKKITRLIYPAPDLSMPFLGVHVTKCMDGRVTLGPTAIPAFGRENYTAFGGLHIGDSSFVMKALSGLLISNKQGFRKFVRHEFSRYFSNSFLNEGRALTPELSKKDIGGVVKIGIRAQLFDNRKKTMENDFIVDKGANSLHVLNAVSPAFTSSPALAKNLVEQHF